MSSQIASSKMYVFNLLRGKQFGQYKINTQFHFIHNSKCMCKKMFHGYKKAEDILMMV